MIKFFYIVQLLLIANPMFSQTVNVFLHQWSASGLESPSSNFVDIAYSNHFTIVNITTGTISPLIGSLSGYDVVWITEMSLLGGNTQMNNAQRLVVENYIQNGGHIIWVSEQTCCGGTNQPLTAINNLYGITLNRTFSGNDPVLPYHGANGPQGLTSGITSMPTTGNHDIFTGPPSLIDNLVFAANRLSCDQNLIRGMSFFFPGPFICDGNTGTLLLTGEVQQFNSWGHGLDPQQRVHMDNIAAFHRTMISNNTTQLATNNAVFSPNGVCGVNQVPCNILLAIEWIDFVVKKDNDYSITLNWTTFSEQNNSGFEIEHALPTTTMLDFENIGWVTSKGNAEETQYYNYNVAPLISGTHYFRLKLIEEDGSHSYSEIRAVHIEEKNKPKVFPTYIANTTNCLNVFVGVQEGVKVDIINMLNQQVTHLYTGILSESKYTTIPIDVANFTAGNYVLRIKGKTINIIEKVSISQ